LVILTDDQGCWALGAASNSEIHTPNLDRLAASGLRAENFFCTSPVCSPARASLLTGAIPSRHGVHDWIRTGNIAEPASRAAGWGYDRPIDYLAGLRTYSEILAENGYTCALSGKWHLGDSARPQKGFSHWVTVPLGYSDYYHPWFIRDGQMVQESRYVTDVITEHALAFLDRQLGTQTPFYLSVHYTAPHSPWDSAQHPPELRALYQDCPFDTCPEEPVHLWQVNSAPRGTGARRLELLQGYYAAITALDRGVGQILARLEAIGARENTLVFFTSDNGMNMGHHGIWGKGNGTFPQNMYDTSVKVPAICSHPGVIPAGRVVNELLSHYDVLPTLLDYLQLESLADERLPGRSFAPLLRSESFRQRENVVVFDEYGPVRMIRSQDWKYVHRYPYGPHELYDLVNDPAERHNAVADPAHQGRVAELKAQLDEWFVRYADPARDGVHEPVTGKGQVDLAGVAGQGRTAFAGDWFYIDAEGQVRSRRGGAK
jgi:choline-sulfatase